jgi:hypothetical protein
MAARIEFRERRGGPRELWALHAGKRREVRDSAVGLLRELREDLGHRQAQVYINGRRVQLPRQEATNG